MPRTINILNKGGYYRKRKRLPARARERSRAPKQAQTKPYYKKINSLKHTFL